MLSGLRGLPPIERCARCRALPYLARFAAMSISHMTTHDCLDHGPKPLVSPIATMPRHGSEQPANSRVSVRYSTRITLARGRVATWRALGGRPIRCGFFVLTTSKTLSRRQWLLPESVTWITFTKRCISIMFDYRLALRACVSKALRKSRYDQRKSLAESPGVMGARRGVSGLQAILGPYRP